MSAPARIMLTRRGFLAAQLLRSSANPNAGYDDVEAVVERIAGRGETRELLLLANLTEFPEKKFPDGGRS